MNNVLHVNQFGFRSNKLTSTALANVLISVISKINDKKCTIFTLLDLKKAFDLINHDMLLAKLQLYGIRGLPLTWVKSYLYGRRQKTKVNGNFSTYKAITAGVPQGSILGSLMFILFINDVFQFCSKNVEIYQYADDTAIIFHADCDDELQLIVDDFFKNYVLWCMLNCIVVNPTKSNYLAFNSKAVVSINDVILANPEYVKYLGILFDNELSWKHRVNSVITRCSQRIGIFKKVLCYLP